MSEIITLMMVVLLFGTPTVLIVKPKWYQSIAKNYKNPNLKFGFLAFGLFVFLAIIMPEYPENQYQQKVDSKNQEQAKKIEQEKLAQKKAKAEQKTEQEVENLINQIKENQNNDLFERAKQKVETLPEKKRKILYPRLQLAKIHNEQAAANSKVMNNGLYSVVRVIDGDTIHLNINGKTEKVRIIGLDTPEVHHPSKPVQCFGREASRKMTELVGGKQVRIE